MVACVGPSAPRCPLAVGIRWARLQGQPRASEIKTKVQVGSAVPSCATRVPGCGGAVTSPTKHVLTKKDTRLGKQGKFVLKEALLIPKTRVPRDRWLGILACAIIREVPGIKAEA